jgi:cation:H+ antiporter
MVWVQFFISAAVVVVAANYLAKYGDIIAVRTKLGGLFVGTIFLAGATSLPELIASVSAFQAGFPNLAAGNFFGSNMVNMLLLALVDLINYQVPLLRRIAISHALTAALTMVLMLVATISIIAEIDITIGWIGLDSIAIIALYFGGIWLIQQETKGPALPDAPAPEPDPEFPTLRRGIIGFRFLRGIDVCGPRAGQRQHADRGDHRSRHRVCGHGAAQRGHLIARTAGGAGGDADECV